MTFLIYLTFASASALLAAAVGPNAMAQNADQTPRVALQPFAQQVRQAQEALSFLGQPLLAADAQQIKAAMGRPDEAARWPKWSACWTSMRWRS